jgi:D-amino-acid dehydrogenase
MFTLTEADSYNSRAWPGNDLLLRPVSAHGWRIAKPGNLSAAEQRWADDFHRMPGWLADSYNTDIFDMNRTGGTGWANLVESDPGLFGAATGYRDGILRLFTDEEYFHWHVARNDRVGATRRVLTPREVSDRYPALADACAAGTVAGGLEVAGFTVNIHGFLARLVDLLAAEGVRFRWQTAVTGIHRGETGQVDGLVTAAGVVRSDHYVLSPGVYGDSLLRGTQSHERIQGMLGVWLTVPNVEPRLAHSVKIARKGHDAEETNVTLGTGESGEPVLICGAGYGWTGLDPGNIDSTELEAVYDALKDTIRRFFPESYAAARDTLDHSRRVCVRPWTSSCLGVFETVPAAGGGVLTVTGGHNTGGFTQAPVVADAVLAAFEGRSHRMHTRYHPRRLERFYSVPDAASWRITS